MNLETKLWLEYWHYHSILVHYERQNLQSKERIFAEADMMRAADKIYQYTFKKLHSQLSTNFKETA
jgi:hypothetical protein